MPDDRPGRRTTPTSKSWSSTTAAATGLPRSSAPRPPRIPASAWFRSRTSPPGWTGKTHALHVAAADAKGAWLWFVDSDTRHEPSSLPIVLEYARRHDAALASLLPEMRCETFWEKVVQPLAGVVLLQTYPLFLVNNPKYKLAFANGQYILIRRDAYDAVGGHESVRDRFVEDIYLAREVKSKGLPIRVAIAQGIGSTRMYTSLPTLIRGWSRILYDANHRSVLALVSKIFDQLIFNQSAHIALISALLMFLLGTPGPFPWLILSLSLIHHIWIYLVFRRLYHASIPQSREIWLYPLAGLVIDWILLKGIWSCWTGRVQWRGTAYK